jgi:glyoxylase-like metal-dependent hydrolase (beta-lactamase superfamily II)
MPETLRRISFLNQFNIYLISTPRGLVLIDSAVPGMFGWLTHSLRKIGVEPGQLAGVVVTHFHIDHVGTALCLQRLGVPMYALAEEIPILLGKVPHPGYGGRVGRVMLAAEKLVFGRLSFDGVQPLEAGQMLFESNWKVIAAPGHTPGNLALLNEATGDLLSGDTLVSDFGCPRFGQSLFAVDHKQLMTSALDLLDLKPTSIHPGHGKPLPLSAYARVHERLIDRLKR